MNTINEITKENIKDANDNINLAKEISINNSHRLLREHIENNQKKRIKGLSKVPANPKIEIFYHDPNMPKLDFIGGSDKSNWIDLYTAEDVHLKKGEFTLISMGISAKIPDGTEVRIAPRSSSYKNFKVLFTNSVGIIDTTYCGQDDIWKSPILAMEDTFIPKYSRICQFRLNTTMTEEFPSLQIVEVDKLDGENRGGFGSTGK